MSLWMCPIHGLYGGDVFCPQGGGTGDYTTIEQPVTEVAEMVNWLNTLTGPESSDYELSMVRSIAAILTRLSAELERKTEALKQVLAYREGRGPFAFHKLPANERDNAAFDAWQEVEAAVRVALASQDQHRGQ